MIDFAKIKVIAGSGGSGAVSFFKLLNMRYGRPDGGDGGRGGNIFIVSDSNIFDLEHLRGRKEWKAESGDNGRSNEQKGKEGADLTLTVPCGTVVTLNLKKGDEDLVFTYDLETDQEKIMVAKGGIGGHGNTHARFKRDYKGKKPEHWDIFNTAQPGRAGEVVEITLELKYLAQVGLIGLPNAGKSSLLASLTHAQPKIANYPFTTLVPNIGVLENHTEKVVMADIPGIIEGASKGKGLGLTFLKHIERTALLLHVVDISDDNYYQNYQTVRNELKYYSKDLVKKKEIVILNKIDLLPEKEAKKRAAKFKKAKPILASVPTKEGVEQIRASIVKCTSAESSGL